LSEALRFARSRKAGLENEPRILADLANAYRMDGDRAKASATAEEAMRIATERHARIPECLARMVRGQLLLCAAGEDEKAEGAREIERAKASMQETGAVLYKRFLAADIPDSSGRSVSTGAI
jgi:adenylate cyclase